MFIISTFLFITMWELLLVAIAPVLFLAYYVYKKDKFEPEPLQWLVKVFFLGVLIVVPAFLIEYMFIYIGQIYGSILIAPFVEEGLKFLVVYYTVFRDQEFSEPFDGIMYAVMASLGFASVENILYVVQGGMGVGISRAFLSIPAHALFAAVWGYALGIAKFKPKEERGKIIVLGLGAGIFLHGLYNYLATLSNGVGILILFLVFMPLGFWLARKLIFKALKSEYSEESRARAEAAGKTPSEGKPGDEPRPIPPGEKKWSDTKKVFAVLIVLNLIGIPLILYYIPSYGPCPAGYVRDPEGHTCYKEGYIRCNCGDAKYCEPGGECCNNTWISQCPTGYTRDPESCVCYKEGYIKCNCGDAKYCEPGGECCNNIWYEKCPPGTTRNIIDCSCRYNYVRYR